MANSTYFGLSAMISAAFAACAIGPEFVAGAAAALPVVAAMDPEKITKGIEKGAGAILSHLVSDDIKKVIESLSHRPRKRGVKNHDLHRLMVKSIAQVLDDAIEAHPGGKKQIKRYIREIEQRLSMVVSDGAFKAVWEQSISGYFGNAVTDFSSVTVMKHDLWRKFLDDAHDVKPEHANFIKDEQATLDVAAAALHTHLVEALVTEYRKAFEEDPEIYAAVQMAVYQDILAAINLVGKDQKILKGMIPRLYLKIEAFAGQHKAALERLATEHAEVAGVILKFTDDFEACYGKKFDLLDLLPEIHQGVRTSVKLGEKAVAGIDELLRRDDARQSQKETARSKAIDNKLSIKTNTYMQRLAEETAHIELRGIKNQLIKLPVADSYVPLRGLVKNASRIGKHEGEREIDVELNQILDNPKLGDGRHLVVVGGAGSGKTTVLWHMAWALSAARHTQDAGLARRHLGLNLPLADLPLPIFAPLAALAGIRAAMQKPKHARHGASESLEDLLTYYLIDAKKYSVPEGYVGTLLENQREVILLLDGMDEVADDRERTRFRDLIDTLSRAYACLRVVATCRTVAYKGQVPFSADFKEIAVQHLKPEYVTKLVEQAYAHMQGAPEVLLQGEKNLHEGIKALERERKTRLGDRYVPLVDTPLMVRVLLIVQSGDSDAKLPSSRAALFDKAVETMLNPDYGPDGGVNLALAEHWEIYRDMLQYLAFHMHKEVPSAGGKDQGVVSIGRTKLRSALRKEDSRFAAHIPTLLKFAHDRAGLLEEQDGRYRFIHLAFQEFLAARYLCEVNSAACKATEEPEDPVLAFLTPWVADSWWREPILQVAGYWAIPEHDPELANAFLQKLALAGGDPNTQFAAAELAATAALEWQTSDRELRQHCAQRVADLLSQEENLKTAQPVIRARAALAMSHLGDPRVHGPELFCLPKGKDGMLGFVYIEKDDHFKIGTRIEKKQPVMDITGISEDWIKHELNNAETCSPEFCIARYPFTVAQFRAYLQAMKKSADNERALLDAPSQPVRYVSWGEALDYCKWLNLCFASADSKKLFKKNR